MASSENFPARSRSRLACGRGRRARAEGETTTRWWQSLKMAFVRARQCDAAMARANWKTLPKGRLKPPRGQKTAIDGHMTYASGVANPDLTQRAGGNTGPQAVCRTRVTSPVRHGCASAQAFSMRRRPDAFSAQIRSRACWRSHRCNLASTLSGQASLLPAPCRYKNLGLRVSAVVHSVFPLAAECPASSSNFLLWRAMAARTQVMRRLVTCRCVAGHSWRSSCGLPTAG